MDLLDQQTADRIAHAMGQAGLDVEQLAARTGLDAAVLTARLAAASPFTVAELVLVTVVLDCDSTQLLTRSGSADA
ncbi:DprA-like winged helix domain-containing protein [Nocardia heshunensis]